MSAHTPAPWTVSEYKDGRQSIIIDGEGFYIALVDYPNRDANTRRIVACVNACEGIDTESLEADGYGENWAEIARHRLELMELVAIMEEKHAMNMAQAQAELQLLRDEVKAMRNAVEAMRIAGGSMEFQAAFDAAKVLAANKEPSTTPPLHRQRHPPTVAQGHAERVGVGRGNARRRTGRQQGERK